MRFLEELDREHRGQAAEDIEVVPLDDVSYRGGDDHAPEVFRHLWTSHFRSPARLGSVASQGALACPSPPSKRFLPVEICTASQIDAACWLRFSCRFLRGELYIAVVVRLIALSA